MVAIRKSPSGPLIQNAEGAALNIGPGMVQRSWSVRMTAQSFVPNATGVQIRSDMSDPVAPNDFRVVVPDPDPLCRYVARVRFDFLIDADYAGGALAGLLLRADNPAQTFLNQAAIPLSIPGGAMDVLAHVDFESDPFDIQSAGNWQQGNPVEFYAELSAQTVSPLGSLSISSTGELGTAILEVFELF